MRKNFKTTRDCIHIDEELKSGAQKALDDIELPLALAVELFLKQVAKTGKLPFTLGAEREAEEARAAREQREHDFWEAFIVWYFRAWPRFDSPEMAKRAETEFGYRESAAGKAARSYIMGGEDGSLAGMDEAQLAAYFDISEARILLSDAKELIYWALGMDKVFVPKLSGTYGHLADAWRYRYLQERGAPIYLRKTRTKISS